MQKRINKYQFLMILIITLICFLGAIAVLYHNRTSSDSFLATECLSIIDVSNPSPSIINEGEKTTYYITLNKPCDYMDDLITISGPAQVTDIKVEENQIIVTATAKSGNGNAILNIAEGAFEDSGGNKTTEIFKDGLTIDNTEKLKKLVEDYVGDYINNIGLLYYDLKTNITFEINADTQFFPASTSKLYAVITLYDLAFQNKIDINKAIKYNRNHYEAGSGILQGMDLSKEYDLGTLSDYAIIYSDNIAFHMIYSTYGYSEMKSHYEKIIGHPATLTNNTPNMSARDAYLLMKKVYDNEDNNELYSRLINNMKNTIFTDTKIVKYLPQDIVARKGGAQGGNYHDVAIIYDENPYILTIFTKNVINADEMISQVSKIIYDNR